MALKIIICLLVGYLCGNINTAWLIGKIKNVDPKLLATEFYSTIYTLLTVCDRDPNYEPEAIILLENHIKQFNKNYGKG